MSREATIQETHLYLAMQEPIIAAWWTYEQAKEYPLTIYPTTTPQAAPGELRTRRFSRASGIGEELHGLINLMPETHTEPNVYIEGTHIDTRVSAKEYMDGHLWFSEYPPVGDAAVSARNRALLLSFDPDVLQKSFLLEIIVSDQWDHPDSTRPMVVRSYLFLDAGDQVSTYVLEQRNGTSMSIRQVQDWEREVIVESFFSAIHTLEL